MVLHVVAACVLAALAGYLLGSILFSVLISKAMFNEDVRTHGSGNAGMTNVLRTYGKLPAVLTIIGDVGKSVAAASIGRALFASLIGNDALLAPVCGAYLAAIFCMIGHSRPLYFGFKGGKCVLVGAGAALFISPLVCGILLLVFLVQFAFTRIVSFGSILVAALFPIVNLLYWIALGANVPTIIFNTLCCAIMATMVIWLHRANIQRLKQGTEYRFGSKK